MAYGLNYLKSQNLSPFSKLTDKEKYKKQLRKISEFCTHLKINSINQKR